MKTLLSLPALAFAGGIALLSACAQNADTTQSGPANFDGSGRHHRNVMAQALSQLQLTTDEQTKIDQLRSAYRAKEKGVSDPDQRKADAKQFRSDVLGVLTPDQVTQFKANMKALRAANNNGRGTMPMAQASPQASPQ